MAERVKDLIEYMALNAGRTSERSGITIRVYNNGSQMNVYDNEILATCIKRITVANHDAVEIYNRRSDNGWDDATTISPTVQIHDISVLAYNIRSAITFDIILKRMASITL